MGFYLHKVFVNDIVLIDQIIVLINKLYLIQKTDYDLIIGRKTVESLNLRIVDVVRIISNDILQMTYIKINTKFLIK